MYLIVILLITYMISIFTYRERYINYYKLRPEREVNKEVGIYNQKLIKNKLGCKNSKKEDNIKENNIKEDNIKKKENNIEEDNIEEKNYNKEMRDFHQENKRILDKDCFFYDIFYYDNEPFTFKYKEKDCNIKDNLLPSNEFDYYDFSLKQKKTTKDSKK